MSKVMPTMIVHGGAGGGKFGREDGRYKGLLSALEEGMGAMRKGSSLDGVEAAVMYLEDSGLFNAGRGACLTAEGKVELDGAVMTGESLRGAGVGLVTCTYHPVSLARWVSENTSHVLVAGDACETYARKAGEEVIRVVPSAAALSKFGRVSNEGDGKKKLRLWRKIQEGNTVGAVGVDSSGTPSAGVSTGGTWLKLPGRIGDSAIIGAGVYADERGAACATGTGEEIVRLSLCLRACGFLRGSDAQSAARRAVGLVTRSRGRGTAGIITVDRKGRIGASYNTEAMGRAWYDASKGKAVVRV